MPWEINLAIRADAEAITCGCEEIRERGMLGDKVHCHHKESNTAWATDAVAFSKCSTSNAEERLSKTIFWQSSPGGPIRDEQCCLSRETQRVWSSYSCGSFSPSPVVEMMVSYIAKTDVLSWCCTRRPKICHRWWSWMWRTAHDLCGCAHDVIAVYQTHVITKTPL